MAIYTYNMYTRGYYRLLLLLIIIKRQHDTTLTAAPSGVYNVLGMSIRKTWTLQCVHVRKISREKNHNSFVFWSSVFASDQCHCSSRSSLTWNPNLRNHSRTPCARIGLRIVGDPYCTRTFIARRVQVSSSNRKRRRWRCEKKIRIMLDWFVGRTVHVCRQYEEKKTEKMKRV